MFVEIRLTIVGIDTSWANDPITITRINEHSHPSNEPPSLLGPSPWASFEFGH